MRIPFRVSRFVARFGSISLRSVSSLRGDQLQPGTLSEMENLETLSTDEFVRVLPSIRQMIARPDAIETAFDRFKTHSHHMSTDSTLEAVRIFAESNHIRRSPQFKKALVDILEGTCSHGVSSFSLSAILELASLSKRLNAHPDTVFIKSLCQRVVGVRPRDADEQVDLLAYLIRLRKIWELAELSNRILEFSDEQFQSLSISDFKNLFDIIPSMDENGTFHVVVENAFNSRLKNQATSETLRDLTRVSSKSDLFRMALSHCESKVLADLSLAPATDCLWLLNAWARVGAFPDFVSSEDRICIASKALRSENQSIMALPAIGTLFCAKTLPLELRDQIIDVLMCMDLDISERVEDFLKAVDTTTRLELSDVPLIGLLASRIDAVLTMKNSLGPLWKLATWWHFTKRMLPFDTIVPRILMSEFSHSIGLLDALDDGSLLQPYPNQRPEWTVDITENLMKEHVVHTILPVIKGSPLRAHFRINQSSGTTIYCLLSTDSGALLPIGKEPTYSVEIYKRFVRSCGAKLSILPMSKIVIRDSDIQKLIEENLLE